MFDGAGQRNAFDIYSEVALFGFTPIEEPICRVPTDPAVNIVDFGTHLKG